MRKYSSFGMLYVRSVIFKVAVLLLVMAAVETGLFFWAMDSELPFIYLIDQSRMGIVFALVLYLVCMIFLKNVYGKGSKAFYTMERLRIRSGAIQGIEILCNLMFYVVITGVQLLLIFIFLNIYGRNISGGIYQGQNIFLGFYQNHFLNALLPLENWNRLIQSITCVVVLSALPAGAVTAHKNNMKEAVIVIMAVVPAVYFLKETKSIAGTAAVLLCWLFERIYSMVKKQREKEDENEEM